MEEISFAFRPYYKVELGMPERQAATDARRRRRWSVDPAAARGRRARVVDEPDRRADVAVDAAGARRRAGEPPPPERRRRAGANGRRGLFGR